MSTSYVRAADSTTTCGRNAAAPGDAALCGAYFLITDPVGRPVVMLDSSQRVTGTGEYDPFGQVNRVPMDAETAHPYGPSGTQLDFVDFTMPSIDTAKTQLRVKFQALDVAANDNTNCPSGSSDAVNLVDKSSHALRESLSGKHAGTGWSFWIVPVDGSVGVQANMKLNNPLKLSGTCVSNRAGNELGAIIEGFEYRRVQTGATAFWTPLREPGQYHDEETDLNQNWNRFYDPSTGRNLEPEPMWLNPKAAIATTLAGAPWPVYAYAGDNPIGAVDLDGLTPEQRQAILEDWNNWMSAATADGRRGDFGNDAVVSGQWIRQILGGRKRRREACGEQATDLRDNIEQDERVNGGDYTFRTVQFIRGVFSHQFVIAASKADNDVLVLDPFNAAEGEGDYSHLTVDPHSLDAYTITNLGFALSKYRAISSGEFKETPWAPAP